MNFQKESITLQSFLYKKKVLLYNMLPVNYWKTSSTFAVANFFQLTSSPQAKSQSLSKVNIYFLNPYLLKKQGCLIYLFQGL